MKAKFIRESLHFERGIEPNVALGLGILGKRDFDTVDEAAHHLIKNINTISEGIFETPYNFKNAVFKIPEKKRKKGNFGYLRFIQKYINGYDFSTINNEVPSIKYKPLNIKEIPSGNPIVLLNDLVKAIKDYFLKNSITESLNFERGRDPKQALGLGLIHNRVFNTTREAAENLLKHIVIISNGMYKSTEQFKSILIDGDNARLIKRPYNSGTILFIKDYIDGINFYGGQTHNDDPELPYLRIRELEDLGYSKLETLKAFRDELMSTNI